MYCFQCTLFGVKLHLQNILFFPMLRKQEYG
jgi:hypothetical protein